MIRKMQPLNQLKGALLLAPIFWSDPPHVEAATEHLEVSQGDEGLYDL